jgi:hypothetical protein
MDGKVFSKENKKFLVDVADKAVKLPWYAEAFDGPGFTAVINWVDKNGDKVIPDTLDVAINEIVDAAEVKDWALAEEKAATALNLVINIPLLEEEQEQQVLVDAVRLVIQIVRSWIASKKKKE